MSLDWLPDALSSWDAEGRTRRRRTVVPCDDGTVLVDDRRLVNLAGNDYLGLAGDPRVRAAARAAIDDFGFGSRASALVSGRSTWHAQLEERIAAFKGEEAAVLFPTGYAANVGTIASLVGADDSVFCDRLNHASLIDGCRLSGARLRVYPHLDLETLERELTKAADRRRRLIVTDSVFSMDGDVAPLVELQGLAGRHRAMLLIDEAHATGVLGDRGRGLAEHFHLKSDNLIRVGTLSKALGSIGGFVSGSRNLVDWLWNTSRPQVFSTAFPPSAAAAAMTALDLVEAEPRRRQRLVEMASLLRNALCESGRNVPGTLMVTPIIPIVIGDEQATLEAATAMEQAGFLVGAIRPPTVPRGTSRLRLSLHALLNDDDIDRCLKALDSAIPR